MVVLPAPERPVNHTTLLDIRTPVVGRATIVPYFTPTGARTSYIERGRGKVVGPEGGSVPDVGAFLLGAPKSGTTWLAAALEQHPEICVSEPKEPNEVATHKGTFGRDDSLPDWERYASCFIGGGFKLDCSVHALACPVAPHRVLENWPGARFIVCLREPVSRTLSHWNMILDTEEDKQNGTDWTQFSEAWSDDRLRSDTLYGASLSKWYELFPSDRFLLIDSTRMRSEPGGVLAEVESHLGVNSFEFKLDVVRTANTASDRRPLTVFGKFFKSVASMIPSIIKRPFVSSLQGRGINVYKMPVLSSERKERVGPIDSEMVQMKNDIQTDLAVLEELTGFDSSAW